MLFFKRFKLPIDKTGRLELTKLSLVVLPFALRTGESLPQGRDVGTQLTQTRPDAAALLEGVRIAGEAVKHGQLEILVGKEETLVLGMDVHEPRREPLKQSCAHRHVVDETP